MQRRKFVAGLGSLAAAGAAGIGTGAFTQASASRAVNAEIAADESSFLQLSANASTLDNGEYAAGTSDGKLALQFDSDAGVGGDGLGAASEYYFDNVFEIVNQGDDQVRITIDKSGMDNPDAFSFYPLYRTDENQVIGGRDGGFTNLGISVGFGINVGVKIETPDELPESSPWESGTVEIVGTDTSEVEGNTI